MLSPAVEYNPAESRYEADCSSGYLDTQFVFPPDLKDGDELPDFYLFNVPNTKKPFRIVGNYDAALDNLQFALYGPRGYFYKISIQMDALEDEPYIWKVKKHGTEEKRRVWHKLHIAVDTSTHEIIAAELSLSNVTDAEVLPNLLKQTHRKIIKISGDGTYDTRDCHDAIRVKRAAPLIPPRERAAFWEQGHPRNLAVGCQKLYGSNKKWKMRYGYHKRSLSETAMYRVKQLLGGKLSIRNGVVA